MFGKNIGVVKLLKQEVNHIFVEFHYIMHQEALCAKSKFKSLESVIGLVNKRQFTKLLNVADSQFSWLIMYNKVRCQSFEPIF